MLATAAQPTPPPPQQALRTAALPSPRAGVGRWPISPRGLLVPRPAMTTRTRTNRARTPTGSTRHTATTANSRTRPDNRVRIRSKRPMPAPKVPNSRRPWVPARRRSRCHHRQCREAGAVTTPPCQAVPRLLRPPRPAARATGRRHRARRPAHRAVDRPSGHLVAVAARLLAERGRQVRRRPPRCDRRTSPGGR